MYEAYTMVGVTPQIGQRFDSCIMSNVAHANRLRRIEGITAASLCALPILKRALIIIKALPLLRF